jgi:hypothetical protein
MGGRGGQERSMDRAVTAKLHDHVHLSHVWKASDATSISITAQTFAIYILSQIQYTVKLRPEARCSHWRELCILRQEAATKPRQRRLLLATRPI